MALESLLLHYVPLFVCFSVGLCLGGAPRRGGRRRWCGTPGGSPRGGLGGEGGRESPWSNGADGPESPRSNLEPAPEGA